MLTLCLSIDVEFEADLFSDLQPLVDGVEVPEEEVHAL